MPDSRLHDEEFLPRHLDRMYIGGKWMHSAGHERLAVINPATGNLLAMTAGASSEDVELAIQAADSSFRHGPWARLTAAQRAPFLRRIAKALRARAPAFAHAVTSEMGAPIRETHGVAIAAANLFEYYATLAESLPEEEPRAWTGGGAFTAWRPVGVVGAIVPWNAPLSLAVLKLAPALAAGCSIIVKAAPSTPLNALLLAECVAEADLPPGVVSILPGGNAAGDALVRDPRVDKVTFTGSTRVGQMIGGICGERIARQALELGGKSAAIVLPDMDAQTVARQLAPASLRLTGQACSALTRVFVPRQQESQLVEAIAAEFATWVPADPLCGETRLGPLALERQRDQVERYVALGQNEGARIVLGGKRPASPDGGFFYLPTLFDRADNGMRIAREEIFGPVVCVIPYDGEDEAVRLANDNPYGLYASIFTHDVDAVRRLARHLRSGNVSRAGLYIDRTLPYGGFGQSGVGREGGIEGLRGFQEQQTLYLPQP